MNFSDEKLKNHFENQLINSDIKIISITRAYKIHEFLKYRN